MSFFSILGNNHHLTFLFAEPTDFPTDTERCSLPVLSRIVGSSKTYDSPSTSLPERQKDYGYEDAEGLMDAVSGLEGLFCQFQ